MKMKITSIWMKSIADCPLKNTDDQYTRKTLKKNHLFAIGEEKENIID